MNKTKMSTNQLIKIALLSAIAVMLMYFDFPVLAAFPWLKIDLSDVPAVIGAFAYGPLGGVAIEGMKNILIFFIKGTQTAGVGELANFIIGIAMVIPAGLIYAKEKTRKKAIIALVAGTISMAIVGSIANYFILIPLYKNFLPALNDNAYVVKYIVAGVIPFNLIKGVIVSMITVVIYKQLERIIK